MPAKQFAVFTGASTGIDLELAKCCANEGFDLVIAANEPAIETEDNDEGADLMHGVGGIDAVRQAMRNMLANNL